ncbi:MAG: hypothetical protein JEZ07_10100 [Phycisphaerae bacterium]|nr:hypothetical protein [Phycisphaerae bacterium]
MPLNNYLGSVVEETTWLDSVVMAMPDFPDINNDCFVNLEDFAILASQWQDNPGIPSADLYPDGIIDLKDLNVLIEYWFQRVPGCLQ